MEGLVLNGIPVVKVRRSWLLILTVLTALWVCAQPPAPRKLVPPERVADVKRKLESIKPINITAQRALTYSATFIANAAKAQQAGRSFQADRLADAADAMIHVAEHQNHLHDEGPPRGPVSVHSTVDHLQRVYFRVQQADYFLKQSSDSRVAAFPKWARDFYQLAIREHERKDEVAADENAKSAEDIVKCLEDLAQAANISDPPLPSPPNGLR